MPAVMQAKPNAKLSWRPTNADWEHLATLADVLRKTTGRAFVSRTDAIQVALCAAATGTAVAEVLAAGRLASPVVAPQ
jgi:hypothetical protein